MINTRRHKRLLQLLDEHGQASTDELVQWLPASSATVRRDLAWLAARQQLERIRGGARPMPVAASHPLRSQAFQDNLGQHAAEKRAIARHAASLCQAGETVIINGGSTTFMMAEPLAALPRLRILTNSFLMAERLLTGTQHEVVLPGGSVYREQNVILSPFDDDMSRHHYAGTMFMGVHGLCSLGLMEADPLLVQAERRLINQAQRLVVLMDSSKFNRRSGLLLCGLDRLHCLVTDTGAPDLQVQRLERAGVQVVTVAPDPQPCPVAATAH